VVTVGELARPAGVLRYVDRGAGPTVVCVHGNPTWSYHFRNLVRVLADDHRVIVPDHLGMGRSDVPARRRYGYDLAARVDDFGALMDHLQIGADAPATLVVHDWGGAIALSWAVRHPERVGRLVLTNTAAFPLLPGQRLPWVLRPARVPVLGEALVCGANAFVRGTLRLGVRRRRLPPEVRRAYRNPYRTWHERTGVLEFVRDVPAGPGGRTHALLADAAANLDRLADRPTLIVWGLHDPVLTAPYLDEWRRRLPGAEVHALADAGHLVLEDAGEAVPLIAAFLARTTSGMMTS
jgi:pimeloyl-ACP methyl ester carboxylesterase